MLIRPFVKQIEEIDDIKNITQKNRYIIIYRYSGPHETSMMNTLRPMRFNDLDNYYDVYLINDSQIDGVNYYIPRGIKLFNRNAYRGISQNILLPGNKINYVASISFTVGTYLNRIIRPHDTPLVLSSVDSILNSGYPGGTAMEEEVMRILNSEYIQPYPEFYNVEHQARMNGKYGDSIKIGDFLYDYGEMKTYTLKELIDSYTKIAIVDIPTEFNIVDPYTLENNVPNPYVRLNNGKSIDLESLKSEITKMYLDIVISMSRTVFSACNIVIDIESGLFSVPKDSLKLKFAGLSKDEIARDYARICLDISNDIDNLSDTSMDVPDAIYANNLSPNRVTMHIENARSLIKISNIYSNTVLRDGDKLKRGSIGAMGSISAGDTDEMVTCWAAGINFGGDY